MKIEKIFRKIPAFENITLDTVLFESKYPVLFTCRNNKDIYLFICYFVNSEKMEWIGTRTTYDNLIELLENKITIRDAFLNVTNSKVMITYDGESVECTLKKSDEIPENILPTVGEYMDAEDDEYEDEIAEFKKRNINTEYIIQPKISRYLYFQYRGVSVLDLECNPEINLGAECIFEYPVKKIYNPKVALS